MVTAFQVSLVRVFFSPSSTSVSLNWFLVLQLCCDRHRHRHSSSVHFHSYRRLNMKICQTNGIIDRIDCKWILDRASGFLAKNVQIQISNFICIHEKIHKIANWYMSTKHGINPIYPTQISIQVNPAKSLYTATIRICSWRHSFKWKEVCSFLLLTLWPRATITTKTKTTTTNIDREFLNLTFKHCSLSISRTS